MSGMFAEYPHHAFAVKKEKKNKKKKTVKSFG
jgi:hypothetical protein